MTPRRSGLAFLLLAALAAGPRAARALPVPTDTVTIAPSRSSIYIGFVTLSLGTLAHKQGAYVSSYAAKVFPYFFWNEQGTLTIPIPEEVLGRIRAGQPGDFEGSALCDDGEPRKITGHAVPNGPDGGSLKVRVFVTKRIVLTFNTTYRFGP